MLRSKLSRIVALLISLGGQAAFAERADRVDPPKPDMRDTLALELAEQRATIDRARGMVDDKLAVLDAERATRIRAIYRVLQKPAADAMTKARRQIAVRAIASRDTAEHVLLADEAAQLADAKKRIEGELEKLRSISLPGELVRPAKGTIARHYGTLAHERSKAILSRRGIDFEVDDRAPVVASAKGIVKYAGDIRGLDRGVIVDHGDYFTVVGKLGEITVPIGATVEAGDRIGRAAKHRVYLEVRVRVGGSGMLVDPEPLLATKK